MFKKIEYFWINPANKSGEYMLLIMTYQNFLDFFSKSTYFHFIMECISTALNILYVVNL